MSTKKKKIKTINLPKIIEELTGSAKYMFFKIQSTVTYLA